MRYLIRSPVASDRNPGRNAPWGADEIDDESGPVNGYEIDSIRWASAGSGGIKQTGIRTATVSRNGYAATNDVVE